MSLSHFHPTTLLSGPKFSGVAPLSTTLTFLPRGNPAAAERAETVAFDDRRTGSFETGPVSPINAPARSRFLATLRTIGHELYSDSADPDLRLGRLVIFGAAFVVGYAFAIAFLTRVLAFGLGWGAALCLVAAAHLVLGFLGLRHLVGDGAAPADQIDEGDAIRLDRAPTEPTLPVVERRLDRSLHQEDVPAVASHAASPTRVRAPSVTIEDGPGADEVKAITQRRLPPPPGLGQRSKHDTPPFPFRLALQGEGRSGRRTTASGFHTSSPAPDASGLSSDSAASRDVTSDVTAQERAHSGVTPS